MCQIQALQKSELLLVGRWLWHKDLHWSPPRSKSHPQHPQVPAVPRPHMLPHEAPGEGGIVHHPLPGHTQHHGLPPALLLLCSAEGLRAGQPVCVEAMTPLAAQLGSDPTVASLTAP